MISPDVQYSVEDTPSNQPISFYGILGCQYSVEDTPSNQPNKLLWHSRMSVFCRGYTQQPTNRFYGILGCSVFCIGYTQQFKKYNLLTSNPHPLILIFNFLFLSNRYIFPSDYKYTFLFTIFSRSLRYILRFFLSLMIYL